MMQKRKSNYYDEESRVYSEKRYPDVPSNYIQFLFTYRRKLLLDLLGRVVRDTASPRTLLEIGCADGVLLRSIEERFPGAFDSMLGTDVSAPMIAMARELTNSGNIQYLVRDELPLEGNFTCAMEIGVGILALETSDELAHAAERLAPGGYFLCSFAGRDSIAARRGSTAADRSLLNSYSYYEQAMREKFDIFSQKPYGMYVPLVWRVPALARLLQPLAEVFSSLMPSLCHEQLYLLKKKSE